MQEPTPLDQGLALIASGVLRADGVTGLIYKTVRHPLYIYERPIGEMSGNGYVRIGLPDGPKTQARRRGPTVYVHRLMWAAHHGSPAARMVVNHRNGVKTDNRLDNLELVSQAANIQHAYDYGLMPSGARHHTARLTADDVRTIRAMSDEGWSLDRLAVRFSVSPTTIRRIRNDESWFASVEAI